MVDSRPLVNIGMPVYNGEKYIRKALDSLLRQDYENFELIISDNASTDRTQEICLKYAAGDERIRYYRNERNMGATWNFNRVFELSSGQYFMWASCHDLWEPVFLERCVEIMEVEPGVVLSYSLAGNIDTDGRKLKLMRGPDTRGLSLMPRCQVVLWGLQYAYPVYGLIRTEVLKKTRLGRPVIGSDLILLLELSLLGEFAQISEVLLHIRQMPDFGSWDKYIEKCFGRPVRGLSRRLLFWKMILECPPAIARHVHSIPKRMVLTVTVLFSIIIKYRGIRAALAASSKG